MDARVIKLEKLKNSISMIHFQDHLSSRDYERIRELEAEAAEVRKSLSGYEGVVCKVTPSYNKNAPFYFTGDRILCCGDEPTYFESEEEAKELYAKSDLADSNYEVEYYKETCK